MEQNEIGEGELLLERVYQEIKWRIVHGRYRPGTSLSESVLARVHRSSRTPVREALSRLLEEGYVNRGTGRGYSVAPLTIGGIRQTFEVRRVLEGTAAAFAAERADERAIDRMRLLADYPALEATNESYQARLSRNDQFHLAVAAGAQNGLLVDLVRHCLLHHDRVLSVSSGFPTLRTSVAQHHEIVDAVARHDVPAAKRAMEEHLDASNALVMEFIMSGRVGDVAV